MTVQALPSEDNYRKLSKMYVDQRPTMEELMVGEKLERVTEEPPPEVTEKPKGEIAFIMKFEC